MNIRKPKRVTCALLAPWVRIEYLIEMEWGDGGECGPPELSLSGRNETAEVATSRQYPDKVCMKENDSFYLFVRGIFEMAEHIMMRFSLEDRGAYWAAYTKDNVYRNIFRVPSGRKTLRNG
ncbi:hypothetical protein EVAR_13128_1 [Eumeta japonica]|uniref:Uncharacterized protein n=1 Tax=Eumeta variegata TaxID=151549 RepID=A0A4C1U9X5_EUMVA|nr:hypothetical protein EVAR_13128_1 [Eumeta japonica]